MQRVLNSTRVVTAQQRMLEWLTGGVTPRRLAFTLALGFAIGCIPLLGVTTLICALVALILGLNMPAIQAANWLAMPLQLLLLYPFLRFGQWLFAAQSGAYSKEQVMAQMQAAPWHVAQQMGSAFGHAVVAWLLTATPALLLLTLLLTPLMNRVSRLAAAQIQ